MSAPAIISSGTAAGGPPVGGSGTSSPSTIPRWTGATTLGDSAIVQSGTNIGISTSSPTQKLDIRGATAMLNANTDGVYGDIAFIGAQGYPTTYLHKIKASVSATPTNALMTFALNSGASSFIDVLTLRGDGNVGIGTAAPGQKLDVNGRIQTNNSFFAALGAPVYMADAGAASNVSIDSPSAGTMRFRVAASSITAATIDSSGNLILNAANTGATIQAAGLQQGIKLAPATAASFNTDPNTLDCYADGGTANSGGVTWTPELRFGGATTGITYTTRVGRYTRVGNTVMAHCYILLSSKGSATGAVSIGGLPTSSALANLYAAASIGYISSVTSTGTITGIIAPSASEVTFYQTPTTGVTAVLSDANFANGSALVFTLVYSVN